MPTTIFYHSSTIIFFGDAFCIFLPCFLLVRAATSGLSDIRLIAISRLVLGARGGHRPISPLQIDAELSQRWAGARLDARCSPCCQARGMRFPYDKSRAVARPFDATLQTTVNEFGAANGGRIPCHYCTFVCCIVLCASLIRNSVGLLSLLISWALQ